MKNIAIILAAGSGVRSGFNSPKQLVKLAGKPVVCHAIRAFELNAEIDEIAIVTNKELLGEFEFLIDKEQFKKVKKILFGGAERWQSSWSAIEAFKNESASQELNLIFHDAVRPLLDQGIISEVVMALKKHVAVDVVIKSVDTIVQTDQSFNFIDRILDRQYLRNGQTPQAFRYSIIREAYEKAFLDDKMKFTDDCGVVLKYLPEVKVFLVNGSSYNQKLTYNEDLAILDRLFQLKKNELPSLDSEKDSSFLVRNFNNKIVVVFGGTSGIGEKIFEMLKTTDCKVYSFSRSQGCDVSKVEDVQLALAKVFDIEGRVDFVVNTSGILIKQPLSLMNHEDILKSINTNYLGSVNVAYSSYKFLEQSKGSLLMFTSSSYTYGRSNYSVYSSSKAAIVNLVQALAEEWATHGIRINCINPERTLTPMRVAAFGLEDPNSLLDPDTVALASLKALLIKDSGLIIDVKKKI